MKKRITRRRKTTKSAGVSKKVKQYVKKLTKTPNRLMVRDEIVTERTVTVGQIYYMDSFMVYNNNTMGQYLALLKAQSVGVKVKYLIYSNSTTTPLVVRFLVLECLRGGDYSNYKQTIAGVNLSSQSDELFEQGVNSTNIDNDLAFSATGSAQNILARINKENYKVHRDFSINLGTSSSDRANFSQGSLWIPFKRVITYDAPAGADSDPINTKMIVLAIPIEVPQDQAVPPTQQIEISAVASWYFRA